MLDYEFCKSATQLTYLDLFNLWINQKQILYFNRFNKKKLFF